MSKLTGKPYPAAPSFTKEDAVARFKSKSSAPTSAPKGIIDSVKDVAAKAFSSKKRK